MKVADAVPANVRDFWSQRVVAAYQAGQYAPAFDEAFRVIELAVVTRSRDVSGSERCHAHGAVGWLLKRSFIKPRYRPWLPVNCGRRLRPQFALDKITTPSPASLAKRCASASEPTIAP